MSAIFIDEKGKEQKRTKCEIYTRVMGYVRPVSHFNTWKKSEFYSRAYFSQNSDFESKYC